MALTDAWVWVVRRNSKGQEESSGYHSSELDELRKCFDIVEAHEGSLSDINQLAVIRDCDMPLVWKTRERAKVLAGMRSLAVRRDLALGRA